jgi:triphosphoribosyl-dephospho-CoA synthetase
MRLAGLASGRLASLAVQAAVLEAATTLKPGLVCMDTRGIHSDMDIRTLVASAFSLRVYFAQAVECGRLHAEADPGECLRRLRALGRAAEKTMFAATGGVNTHKGLIFSQGLLCAAMGRLAVLRGAVCAAEVCAEVAVLAGGIVEQDLAPLRHTAGDEEARHGAGRGRTAGEALYLRYGETGIRGEAEQGFPHALMGLQMLWDACARGEFNRAVLHTLLVLMAEIRDTNILWRGGPDKLRTIQTLARRVLELGGTDTPAGTMALEELRNYCLAQRLSPGGSADMLCLALFLYLVAQPER